MHISERPGVTREQRGWGLHIVGKDVALCSIGRAGARLPRCSIVVHWQGRCKTPTEVLLCIAQFH